MEYLGYFASVIIGLSLGLIGGGGSILAVPILVYLFNINPELATSYSLFIVGITAMIGSYSQYKLGNLKIKPALAFAIPSLLSLLFVREIVLPKIPAIIFTLHHFEVSKNLLILIVFACLMIATSVSMIKKATPKKTLQKDNFGKIALIGLLVGFLTGFLGAGGGFLIIPALLFFANLPMKQAIGTSLLIIFITSLIGFGGDVLNGISINFRLLFTISAIAILGLFIGTYLSKKIDGAKLKPAFGWFLLAMGMYIIIKEFLLN
ncbi:sulfite exporter TauE/SafE family protein [Flavobacterium sp. RSP49]|uniref:sulfite exporter TauE/SafE family protein n=1 Tax=unclassified Flavobacterium TaxID=196869 RepID=UPI000F835F58|nr:MULTISPECIES: sulfite exporter TauE/SafE family protein [unclassified Flavobacterium]RTY88981.1 sulfite exporter TauE/SafE family protein [Flavobacterium sp. RSP15]RTZ01876.1 sulfite exporter TauE/SafE family protein [Flavobacterium sp. RSP49]